MKDEGKGCHAKSCSPVKPILKSDRLLIILLTFLDLLGSNALYKSMYWSVWLSLEKILVCPYTDNLPLIVGAGQPIHMCHCPAISMYPSWHCNCESVLMTSLLLYLMTGADQTTVLHSHGTCSNQVQSFSIFTPSQTFKSLVIFWSPLTVSL